MHDEQRRDQDNPEARFDDALADLFGEAPAEADSPAELLSEPAVGEPQAALVQPERARQPPGASSWSPAVGPAAGPRTGGRSLRRIGCIAVSAVVGALLLCVVILAIIGFIVGDPATPTPVV